MVTKRDTENVTEKVTKNVTIIKSIPPGKKNVLVKFNSYKKQRRNYNSSENTIEKTEKIYNIL